MAFPALRILRRALVAVTLCRVVEGCECWGWWTCTCSWNFCTCAAPAPAPAPAPRPASGPAHDDSKCYHWGYPKAGKWQQDDNCCAGRSRPRARPSTATTEKKECHRENKCVTYEYTCTKCDGAGCDTNYDIESEDGEDYDCYTHFMICWIIWPVAYFCSGSRFSGSRDSSAKATNRARRSCGQRGKRSRLSSSSSACPSSIGSRSLGWGRGPCFGSGSVSSWESSSRSPVAATATRSSRPGGPGRRRRRRRGRRRRGSSYRRVARGRRPPRPRAALRGLRIESVAQTEVTLAWEQGSAQSFEVQWRKTWGAWQNFATVRRSRARVSGLDVGGAYCFA